MTNEHEQHLHELLCAYVLGEVDEAQRAEIERELAGSPELRAERERIEATIGLVRDAMAPAETLSPQATAEVLSAARVRPRRSWYARPVLMAAGIAALIASAVAILRSNEPRRVDDRLADYSPPSPREGGRAKELAESAPAAAKMTDGGGGSLGLDKDELLAYAQTAERGKARDEKRDAQPVNDAVEKNVYRYELFGATETAVAPPATAASEADAATKLFAAADALRANDAQMVDQSSFEMLPGSQPAAESVASGAVQARLSSGPSSGGSAGPSSPGPSGPATGGAAGQAAPFGGRKLGTMAKGRAGGLGLSVPRAEPGVAQSPERDRLRGLGYASNEPTDGSARSGLEQKDRGDEFSLGRGTSSSSDDFQRMSAEERVRWLDLECRRIVEGCRPWPNERPRDMYFRFWGDNPFEIAALDAQSTFSVDVDTASYALARRYLNEGHLPEKAQVRTEEFINYFKPEVAAPREGTFAIHTDLTPSRFSVDAQRSMLRVVVRGREVSKTERKPLALTFVIDVSGSMKEQNRLELVKHALRLLVSQLDGNDSVAVVAFSTDARMILPTTSAANRGLIESALFPLQPDGGTNSQAGLRMGYESALASLRENATNRVVFLSDGVATVGEKDSNKISEEVRTIREKGIYLNTIGVGMNNHNDVLLEQLADKGDGVCNYIDTPAEARRVLVDDFTGAFEPIARDVKVQVEFDPAQVYRYRLLGYENRAIADRDFRNDAVDAGEIGAGHAVTALYEIERTNQASEKPLATVRVRWKAPRVAGRSAESNKLGAISDSADQPSVAQAAPAAGDEAKKAKEPVLGPGGIPRGLPYEKDSMSPVPEGERATEIAQAVFATQATSFEGAGPAYRRAVIVAQFAEFLRRSSHARGESFDDLLSEAQKLDREVENKDFHELVGLVQQGRNLILSNLPSCDELCQTIDAVRRNQILRVEHERLQTEVDAKLLQQLEQQNAELELRIRELLRRRLEQPPK